VIVDENTTAVTGDSRVICYDGPRKVEVVIAFIKVQPTAIQSCRIVRND
jgi:hypothetical protein